MDHEVATKTHAVERYLLGEMPSSERDAFEEHYFACAECADEVKSGSVLMGDMKAALRDLPSARSTSTPGWLSWWRPQVLVPTFAALSLAVVVGYQNTVVLPDLEAPRSMGSAVILDGATRAAGPSIHKGDPLQFTIAVDGASQARLYVELSKRDGGVVKHGYVNSLSANGPLGVYFPGSLGPGKYRLEVRENAGGKELAGSSFEVVN